MSTENEEPFGIEVTTSPLEGMVDGDKISDWMERREDKASVKELIDILSNRAFAAMRSYKRENNSDMPSHATCYYSGGVAFISPVKIESVEDKDKFFEASSEIAYEVGRQYDDQPVIVTFTSTAWSCFFRKEAIKDIDASIAKIDANIDPKKANEAKAVLLNEIVGFYGSMEDVPEDHPLVGKMDLMLFSAHFLSMDGPIQVTKTSLTNLEILPELSDEQKLMLDVYMVTDMPRNRINFDVSEYEPVPYKKCDFEDSGFTLGR
jgi:hypothetical protein